MTRSSDRMISRRCLAWVVSLVAVLTFIACSSDGGEETLTVYSSVTQETVDSVIALFEEAHPGATVELFRAPTGELTARIASELRSDDLAADVLWLTDPLSIQQYQADGLLLDWTPAGIDVVPAAYRTDSFVGTRILNLVIVQQPGMGVSDWPDLLATEGPVAFPDPGFAGSAFGALGYFAQADGYGLEFYRQLSEAGGVQVQSPGDVVTGVAEGRYAAGITLDSGARAAVADGSPIEMVWPASGAIAIYSPIAVVAGGNAENLAREFVELTLTFEAQEAIANTGWQPIRSDVDWETEGDALTFDWATAFDRQEELLDEYRAIFGN